MKRRGMCRKTCNIWCFSSGVLFIALGFLLLGYFESLYDFVIKSALDLTPGSPAYEAWRVNEPPLIMDLHFFNWTNADQIYNPNVKPRFEPIGPYRYEEVKEKINITWNDNNTVTYKYIKRYKFLEEESPRKLDDVLTLINLVPLSAAYKVRHSNFFAKLGLNLVVSKMSNVYETRTAREWIFEGFDEKFLSTLHSVMNVQDKFGWFYGRNNTGPPDVYNMYTKNDENFGRVLELNYRNRTDFFEEECGELVGSAGEFHPINSKRTNISIYSSEMCTYQTLQYVEDVTIKGIKAYKYSATHIFENGTLFPQNKCFCQDECLPSGVLNISACRNNAPVFLSLPHFYGADPYYVNAVEGVKPEKDKHEFYISLEPKSSITVDCAGRMQLNVLLQPIKYFKMYENVPKVLIPIFYFDQVVPIYDDLAPNIKLLQNLPEISKIASSVFIAVGTFFISLVILCIIFRRPKEKKMDYRITSEIMEAIPLQKVGHR